jgi:putative SOS response-associated peptidase YedK
MPVILPERYYDLWLMADADQREQLASLLSPYPVEEMTLHPVGLYVNNPARDDERCLAPLSTR